MTAASRALTLSISLTFALGACLAAFTRAPRAQTKPPRDTPQAVAAPQSTPTQNDAAAPQTPPKPDRDLTLLTASVTDDYGRNVSGLGRERFTLYEGDRPRELLYFDASEPPQSVGIVFDVSRSMRDTAALDFARGEVVRLARQAHKSNEYFVVGFDGRARLLADWTQDEAALIAGLNALGHLEKRKQGTALYDALALALEKVVRGTRARPVVVLVSDGFDSASATKVSALREMLRRSGVLLYAVRVTQGGDASELMPTELPGLAQVTGGRVFHANGPAGIGDAFRRIGLDLHSLYTLGFRPDPADGKWHKLKLKVQPPPKWPGMNARTREGFYADAPAGDNN
jgi:Ca-activated chloride channel family protein